MRILPPVQHTHIGDGAQQPFSSGRRRVLCQRGRKARGLPPARAQLAEQGKYLRPAPGLPQSGPPPNRTHKPSTFPPHTQSSHLTAYPGRFSKTFLNNFLRQLSLTVRSVLISIMILLQPCHGKSHPSAETLRAYLAS